MLLQKLVFVAQLGASIVLYLLIGLSIISIGVIFERWWYFRRRRLTTCPSCPTAWRRRCRRMTSTRPLAMLKNSKSVEAEIVSARRWAGTTAAATPSSRSWPRRMRERRKAFEAGLLFLGTLGNNAPFIGLFGTVLGIVTAFRELGSTQAGSSSGMGNVMGGIAEALVATAVGILVALPAVIAYNVFQKKAVDVEDNAAALGNVVMASLAASCRGHGAGQGTRLKTAPRQVALSADDSAGRATPRPRLSMAGTMSTGGGRARTIAAINVTPLVDVVLVLLVILMVASTYIVAQTLKVQLPQAHVDRRHRRQAHARCSCSRTAGCAGTRRTSTTPTLAREDEGGSGGRSRHEPGGQRRQGSSARQRRAHPRSGQAGGHHEVRHQRPASGRVRGAARNMSSRTVILSLGVHVAIAATLLRRRG